MEKHIPRSPLPVREGFMKAWGLFKEQATLIISISVFMGIVSWFFEGAQTQAEMSRSTLLIVLATIISLVVTYLLAIGLMSILLKIYDGQETGFFEIFSRVSLLPRFFLASILYALPLMVGAQAVHNGVLIYEGGQSGAVWAAGGSVLVVFGLWLCVRGYFYQFLLVDKQLKAWESLQVFNIAGMLTIIGFIVTFPLSLLTAIHIYRFLHQRLVDANTDPTEVVTEIKPTTTLDHASVMTSEEV
jgi:hypothetical protein